MHFSPEREAADRLRRAALQCESMEDRNLPGDSFWSLSFAPIEALLAATAVLTDQVVPTINAGDCVAVSNEDSSREFDGEKGIFLNRPESRSVAVDQSGSESIDSNEDEGTYTSSEATAYESYSTMGNAFAVLYLTDTRPESPVQAYASSAGNIRPGNISQGAGYSTTVGIAPDEVSGSAGSDSAAEEDLDHAALLGTFVDAEGGGGDAVPMSSRAFATSGPQGYSPAQIRHAYGLDKLSYDGSGMTIAIVDAYNAPTILSDANVFSKQFGLPQFNVTGGPSLKIVNSLGGSTLPANNASWAVETSLDVEWAHAIAPKANILLVEANNSSSTAINNAIYWASLQSHIVSMSFGSSEYSTEKSSDWIFNKANTVFTASSGDNGTGVIYPAASPYVLAVGGTSLKLDSSGNRIGAETAWSGSGGGISAYESKPTYQSAFNTSTKRGVPDVSWIADPNTGFAVYDSTAYQGRSGWQVVGGTSAGAPQWAGLVALTDQGRLAAGKSYLSTNSLTSSLLYTAAGSSTYSSNYYDITSGSNGTTSVAKTTTGYDYVTGLGSPQGGNLVPFLISH